MKKTAFSIATLAIGLLLTIAAAASARSQTASSIRVSAAMTPGQETPTPTGAEGAHGTFTATVAKTSGGASIAWKLVFGGLTGNANAAHIHIGAPGASGPVSAPLCGPCTSGQTGTATASDDLIRAIQSGNAYVNVHTSKNPAGEIRGRLSIVTTTRTALVPGQEKPKPAGNVANARGLFTGTVTKTGSNAVLKWKLTFKGLTGKALVAHIHIGARGVSGPVALALCGPCRSGVTGKAKLSAKLLSALQAGHAYVNVHTARNPGGEIRGQLPAAALSLIASSAAGGGGGGGGDDCLYPPCP